MNEWETNLVSAIATLVLIATWIVIICIWGTQEDKRKEREHRYLQSLDDHDKLVIINYKIATSWFKKRKKDK